MPTLLLIKKLDNNVPDSGEKWLRGEIVSVIDPAVVTINPGSGSSVEAGAFVHFTVTDKTPEEMRAYLAGYNRVIDMTVIVGPDPSGLRRVNCRNNNTNASGTRGGWTVEGTDAIITEWNTRYPTCGLYTVGIITGTNPGDTWQCEGTFSAGEAAEFSTVIVEKGLDTTDKRKIWYITPAGMSNIEGAGGSQSGTSAQLNGILRDARLD